MGALQGKPHMQAAALLLLLLRLPFSLQTQYSGLRKPQKEWLFLLLVNSEIHPDLPSLSAFTTDAFV